MIDCPKCGKPVVLNNGVTSIVLHGEFYHWECRPDKPRWKATVIYRTEAGPVDVEHELQELEDLHLLIERGPHWDAVMEIKVERVNHTDSPTLTVEQAQEL